MYGGSTLLTFRLPPVLFLVMNGGYDVAADDDTEMIVEGVLDALRQCRLELGHPQSWAAVRLHCSKGAVSMLETGTRRALLGTVLRYAQVLGAEVTITVRSRTGREIYPAVNRRG